jgi:RimJ/RimL family protein N-acetyltransferase
MRDYPPPLRVNVLLIYAVGPMAQPKSILRLRAATLADVGLVADLQSAVTPDDPRDSEMLEFWWTHEPHTDRSIRLLAERDGDAVMYVSSNHREWKEGLHRFGSVRVNLHPDEWSRASYLEGVERAESWLRAEGAQTSFASIREDHEADVRALASLGYREVRRSRVWHLDLVRGHDRLLAASSKTRAGMKRQGVRLLTLDQDPDPVTMRKIYELDIEATEDVPKTVPWPVPPFDEWSDHWLAHPAHRKDRFWIACEGDAVVGMSVIGYPPRKGIPWTSFTGTARSVRGRGIARALKYETIAQAIALGIERVQTDNDAENAPILHLNEEMGYEPVSPVLELHRTLGA